MKERPILFQPAMVRAMLEGRKTQTRRVLKLPGWARAEGEEAAYEALQRHPAGLALRGPCDGIRKRWNCPYGVPGDRLWVREPFLLDPSCDAEAWDTAHACYASWADRRTPDLLPEELRTQDNVIYAASWAMQRPLQWQPSIHMPRWASRILLEIVGVRVQRLQEISRDDAQAEGAELREFVRSRPFGQTQGWRMDWDDAPEVGYDYSLYDPIAAFGNYINRLHGGPRWNLKPEDEQLWNVNPFVWAIEFRRVQP